MSKTIKNKKPIGFDFWSRRCFGNKCMDFGPVAKWITKRKERQRNKSMAKNAIKNPNIFEKRFPGE